MSDYLFLFPTALALILGVMSPGPSFILVSQTAIARSREAGIMVSLGMGSGSLIFTALAALGLYVVLESVPAVYAVLKIAGGIYLCYLAYKLWADRSSNVEDAQVNPVASSRLKMYLTGLLTQLSNPKTAIVFASVYATFLPQSVPEYAFLILCALAFIIDTSWYVIVTLLLSSSRAQHCYSKYKQIFNRMAGSMMGFMGVSLIVRNN